VDDTGRERAPDKSPVPSVHELALLFLRLGATAFGGPAAHIALMEEEVVQRRRWLTRAKFLDLLGASNMIPGPTSTEMSIHIGLLAGWRGLVTAGVCFILPAMIMVMVLAWAYVQFGKLPAVEGLLYGIKPVIIAVVLQALWRLGRNSLQTPLLVFISILTVFGVFLGVHELLLLLLAGIVAVLGRQVGIRKSSATTCLGLTFPPFAWSGWALGATAGVPFGMWPMFLFFLKVGSILFGGGYVLLAFLRADLVERYHWITEGQLLDAVAVGQVTPGPVFTTATFIGYILGAGENVPGQGPDVLRGIEGALIATAGIFLPAFFFVAISGPLIPRLRRSPAAGAFIDGVVAASLGLMAAVTWELARAALVDWLSVVIAIVSAVMLMCLRWNSTLLIFVGGLIGLVMTR